MGQSFRRKLREKFRRGDFGTLSRYIDRDFSSMPGLAGDYVEMGALEYALASRCVDEKSKKEGFGLAQAVLDIETVFTEEVPICIPHITLEGIDRTKKVRLIMDTSGVQDTEGHWYNILKHKGVSEKDIHDYEKHIPLLIDFYREHLAKGKAISTVESGHF